LFFSVLFLEGFNPQTDRFGDEFCDAVVGSDLFDQFLDAVDEFVVDGDASIISGWHTIPH